MITLNVSTQDSLIRLSSLYIDITIWVEATKMLTNKKTKAYTLENHKTSELKENE